MLTADTDERSQQRRTVHLKVHVQYLSAMYYNLNRPTLSLQEAATA